MAFDRPIEADRVDDLGLLSAFVRAPVLGPIMWILGKKLTDGGKNDDNKENNSLQTTTDISRSTTSTTLHSTYGHGSFPDISSSSVSHITSNFSLQNEGDTISFNSSRKIKSREEEELKLNEAQNLLLLRQKKTRRMSWSDESGQNLVEYYDLSQSSSQQGTPPSPHFPVHKKKPIKSAMRRSCVKNGKAPIHPSECIPSGLAGGSIVMPTGGGYQQMQQNQISSQQQQHHQSSNNANGYISPQYGWYISMTPPTPPHYHDSSQINKKGGQLMQPQQQPPSQPQKKTQNGHTLQINNQNTIKKPATYMTTATNGFVEGRVAPPKPVFTRSLKGVPNNTSGWPSVPL